MPKAVSGLPRVATDTSVASDLSSCGAGADGLSSSFTSGDIVLGHSGLLTRKRSLDNTENIPPFDLDVSAAAAATGSDGKPVVSLLNLAAQQLSQQQRKQRRTVITASSPGGHQRVATNPRRATHLMNASLLHSLPRPHKQESRQLHMASARARHTPQSNGASSNGRLQTHTLHPSVTSSGGGGSSSGGGGGNVRLRRLPKRNLKPLDFSSLHRPSILAPTTHSSQPLTAGATSAGATAGSKPTAVPHSSSFTMGQQQDSAACPSILSLPVSPAQSSPTSATPYDAPNLKASSPAAIEQQQQPPLQKSSVAPDAPSSVHPTPPSTGPRPRAAFSGLLASAYQRASVKHSKRTLCFDNIHSTAASAADDDGSEALLMECDPVLGPRCPVIGDPRGLFDLHRKGIDDLQREQTQRSESKFSEMTRTVREAQAAFEAAVTEQAASRARASRRRSLKHGSSAGSAKGKDSSTRHGSSSASGRPISECKYCGKQYKYHSKLASHEQHCSSRLEALLYSADENEQHIIHCVCGPRHDRPVGERDDLPMVQCDNCLLWLHIECVGIDEDNLPEEYFCPRCEEAIDGHHGSGNVPAMQSTPKRKVGLGSTASSIMSPESHRLATLLAGVPDDGSETEDEPMNLKVRSQTRTARAPRGSAAAAAGHGGVSSEDTMSISDVSEVTRFHRQGSSAKKLRTPAIPRMAQSENNVSPMPTPSRRRRVRAGSSSNQQTVHTDALSSDFLGLPLPESIFTEKPGLAPAVSHGHAAGLAGTPLSIEPGLCTQQASMDDLSRFLSDPPPQWSLAQLSSMLSGAAAAAGTGGAGAGQMMGSNANYLDQALADLGLGLGAVPTAASSGVSPALAMSTSAAPGGDAGNPAVLGTAGTPLSELVDLPVDNEFSALLESIASGNPGTDADPYSSLGTDDGFGGMLNDDLFLGLNTSLPLSAPIGPAAGSIASRGGSRLVAGARSMDGADAEHGSSSTITIMHDDSSLGSHDNVGPSAGAGTSHSNLPPAVRPPPGMPGMLRSRCTGNMGKRSTRDSLQTSYSDQPAGSMYNTATAGPSSNMSAADMAKLLVPPSTLATSIALSLPSNPPSTTGLGDLDVSQLLADAAGSSQLLDWQSGGDALEQELEGLVDFDI
ncbi:hypothetical protein GQ54DRAFT_107293 [Martensiomyces pterosporus]|nr:hypothetical protein GQ54DRAFT_107293 [Martensiomyces pterosporus]